MSAQASSAKPNSIPGVGHIIAVSSGKGGVGKSTVSTNLACALALTGARVGLMDADITGPNIPTMMGVTELPQITDVPGKGEFFIPPTSHGVKVMSMGFLVQGDQPLIWRGPMLHQAVTQFCRQVEWGTLDFLVIDMPPGTGDVQLSLAQLVAVSGAVLVTTPQEIAMQDVRRSHVMWDKVRVPIIGVVENMSYFRAPDTGTTYNIFGTGGGELLAKKFNTKVLAHLPLLPAVREGGDEGRPVAVRDPNSEIAGSFMSLARQVSERVHQVVDPASLIQIGKF
ncbi:MAG: Mrp/NBP35 family ATP-binding protein [Xanthomonadaceae bacterium]|nr:Mrp/NBP35 family ATP-binding protein [Xanthomonadaceae bacterium]